MLRGDRTQADFARFLGLKSQATYANYESGRVPRPKVLSQIAGKLGLNPAYLLEPMPNADEVAASLWGEKTTKRDTQRDPLEAFAIKEDDSRKVPVVSWAKAGLGLDYQDLCRQMEEEIATESRDPNAFAIIIEGDSMEPEYKAGDRVVFAPNEEPRNGDVVVAKFRDTEEVVFKRYRRKGPEGKIIALESTNPDYPPIEKPKHELLFVYPAIDMVRKIRRK